MIGSYENIGTLCISSSFVKRMMGETPSKRLNLLFTIISVLTVSIVSSGWAGGVGLGGPLGMKWERKTSPTLLSCIF